MFTNNFTSLFDNFQNIGNHLEEIRKEQSEYFLKAFNSCLEMQKKQCDIASQALETQIECCTALFADTQEAFSRNGVDRFMSLVQKQDNKQEKAEKAKKAA